MAYSEPAYPPIFPPGFVEITVDALEKKFVAPGFDTPLRRRLTAQLRLFVGELVKLGVHGDIWIDGSYATRKPNPQDVDVVLVLSPTVLSAIAPKNRATLKRYLTHEGRASIRAKWQVDFYVAKANSSSERSFWEDWLSRNPDQSSRKGIPFVQI